MNAARSQQDEFKNQDRATKTRVGCWILLLNFGVGFLVFLLLYRDFMLGLFRKILGD